MPANLTHQFRRAQARYRAATELREQLDALQEMLREIPKHKGTEHLQADIKRKIKVAKETARSTKRSHSGPSYKIDSGGYPQVVVIGPPNAGKSSLIHALTGTDLFVAPYPYSTREPHPAMMPFERARIQLVDTPPIAANHMEPWIADLVRAADALLVVMDLGAGDLLEGCEGVVNQLARHKLFLGVVPESHAQSIGALAKRFFVAANKWDDQDASASLEIFSELYADRFEILPVSVTTEFRIEVLRRAIWDMLDVVRAVPKPPGKPPDEDDPILLPRGSTVLDMARSIHGELADHLKRARVWHCKDHAEGQWVSRAHVIEDGEIFELET
ncbi:MAG: 50S ribosome-binding GTPase [Planctomycetota bacterium]|nr:50S ribosome-binding GTPase [Planctomycetota bacterium]